MVPWFVLWIAFAGILAYLLLRTLRKDRRVTTRLVLDLTVDRAVLEQHPWKYAPKTVVLAVVVLVRAVAYVLCGVRRAAHVNAMFRSSAGLISGGYGRIHGLPGLTMRVNSVAIVSHDGTSSTLGQFLLDGLRQ